jgi:hypothetical protein
MKKVFAVMKEDVLIFLMNWVVPYLIFMGVLAAAVFFIWLLSSAIVLFPLTTIGTLSGLLTVIWLYAAIHRAKEGEQE